MTTKPSSPAERVESEVFDAVRGMVDDQEMLTRKIAERFVQKRREPSGPTSDTALAELVERLASLVRRKEGYWQLAADGDMPKDIMRRKVEELDEERDALQTTLDHARHRDERLDELDRQEQRTLAAVNADVDHDRVWRYETPTGSHTVTSARRALTEAMRTPESRRRIYKGLGLRVEIDAGGRIGIDGDLIPPPGGANGGPAERVANGTSSNTLWAPAAATSSARLAYAWPATSAKFPPDSSCPVSSSDHGSARSTPLPDLKNSAASRRLRTL